MNVRTLPIDWRRQFDDIKPYLAGQGGVIAVRYAGAQCAPNAFIEQVVARFEAAPGNESVKSIGATILLTPHDYRVKYLSGVRTEFERKLRTTLPEPAPSHGAFQGDFLSSNTAGGDQYINANIDMGVSDPILHLHRERWIAALYDELARLLEHHRFLILLQQGQSSDQEEFWHAVWPKISGLVSRGLVLVKMVDIEHPDSETLCDACQHDCEISLPAEFDDRQTKHAIEDITTILQSLKMNERESKSLAVGYVLARRGNVRSLRDGLLGFTQDLREFLE